MATNSSILSWRIPWMEEPGGLQSGEKTVSLISGVEKTEQLNVKKEIKTFSNTTHIHTNNLKMD